MFHYRISEELELRQLQEEDAATLFALMDGSREHLCRWFSRHDVCESVEDAEAFIKMSIMRHLQNGAFDAGIWFREQLCGVIELHTINWEKRRTDIGYWLGAEWQGKGLMTTAVRALADYAFDVLKLHQLTIYCATENHKSRAIPERLGFKLQKIEPRAERINDEYVDRVGYIMMDYQWRGEPHPVMARHLARIAQQKS